MSRRASAPGSATRLARSAMLAMLSMLALLAHAGRLSAQSDHFALDSLARLATAASERYADRGAASAGGYHRVGADFPAMGEHWLHPGVLLSNTIDAERPTILIFATILGKPTLLGVGFVLVTRGEARVSNVPGWPEAWHEHSGLLSDESGVSPGMHSQGDTHVWVLHVWTALANAEGPFAADNWALPFARAGLPTPATEDIGAARALALETTGDAYLRDLLTDAGLRTPPNAQLVDSLIAASRSRVQVIASRSRAVQHASPDDLLALHGEWTSLERSLRTLLGPAVARFLTPSHSAGSMAHHEGEAR